MAVVRIDNNGTGWDDYYEVGDGVADTVDYVVGTQSMNVTTQTLNTFAGIYNEVSFDLSGSNIRVYVKSPNWSLVSQCVLILASDSWTLANSVTLDIKTQLQNPPNGEWIEIVVPRSAFEVYGTPDWGAINMALFRVKDTNSSFATVKLDSISSFTEGQEGVVSITFDDGWSSFYSEGKPIMDTNGFVGTAFIIPAQVGTANHVTQVEVDALHSAGWDISGHSDYNLPSLTSGQLTTEIDYVASYLASGDYRGKDLFAYPYGAWNSAVVTELKNKFIAGFNIDGWNNPLNNLSPFRINRQSVDKWTTTAMIQGWIDAAVANKEWCILNFHTLVDTLVDGQDFLIDDFTTVIEYLNTNNILTLPVSEVLENLTTAQAYDAVIATITVASDASQVIKAMVKSTQWREGTSGTWLSTDCTLNAGNVYQFRTPTSGMDPEETAVLPNIKASVAVDWDTTATPISTVGDFFMASYAQDCTGLTSLSAPDTSGLASVGMGFMFSYANGCTSLTSLSVPDTSGLTSVGDGFMYYYAYGCSSLTSLSAPNTSGLTSVGMAFMYSYASECESLTSLSVPDTSGLTSVGEAFMESYANGCHSLTSLVLPVGTGWFGSHNVDWSVSSGRLGYLKGVVSTPSSETAWEGLIDVGETLYTNYIRSVDDVVYIPPPITTHSERGLYLTGSSSGNSEKSLYLTGSLSNTSQRSLYLTGSLDNSSERSLYLGVVNTSGSERVLYLETIGYGSSEVAMYLSGVLGDSSERNLYLQGKTTDNSERALYTEVVNTGSSSRNMYVPVDGGNYSDRFMYLSGKDTGSSERGLYVTGGYDDSSERSLYLEVVSTGTSERALYVGVVDTDSSERSLYLIGSIDDSGERSLYLEGSINEDSERSLYVVGVLDDASERGLYLTGSIDISSERSLYLTGGLANSSERNLYLTGSLPGESERSLYLGVVDTGSSERSLYLGVVNEGTSERSLYVAGSLDSDSERGLYLSGRGTSSSDRSLYLTGSTTDSSERSLYLEVAFTGDSQRGLYITGCLSDNSERTLYLSVNQGSERGMWLHGGMVGTPEVYFWDGNNWIQIV